MLIAIKKRFLIATTLVFAASTALVTLPIQSQEKSEPILQRITSTRKASDENLGPIVDYVADNKTSNLDNTKEWQLRQMRESRYSRRAPQPLAEFASVDFAIHTDWEVGLEPLPLSQSDAVILGTVVNEKAYLSEDKTGIYSEFVIRVEKVLRNAGPLIKESLMAEREGGVVRFSDGRLLPYKVFRQRLPRLQRNYLFFLKWSKQGEDYHIITAYELRHDRISPLDEPEKFAVFQDMDQEQFMKTVQEAITRL